MQRNILITSAGKRVALTKYFKDTLSRFYPEAKVFTTDMNPEMAPAGYVSDGCFRVPRVTDEAYPAILLDICEKNDVGMVVATIDTELLLLADLKADFLAKGIHVMVSYLAGGNAFNQLNSFLGINRSVKDYLEVYRNHKPDISLTEDVITTLDELKSVGCAIGLITDGRSVQQRHKIDALGLYRWISDGDIVISEEFGSEKPNLANYEYFMNRYSRKAEFYYVGDNPQKDFLAPNSLGWTTICMRDNGQNIHKYDERVNVEANYLIDNIKELLDIIPV